MGAKVLVVEDDNFLVTAYKAKLVKSGFTVQVATDGDEALQALKTFIPDIILLDLIMPKKDGFTVLQLLKADPQLNKVPVIVASNLGQKEDVEKAKGMGAADFIVKSNMSMDDIVQKINSTIGA